MTNNIVLFPLMLHEFDIPDFDADAIIDYCYNERKADPEGKQKSNRGGWQSQDHYCRFDNILSRTLMKGLNKWSEDDIFEKGTQMQVQAMWININGPNCYNMKHNHPNSDLSGVFWVKGSGPNIGSLVFDDSNNYSRFQESVCYSDNFKTSNNLWDQFTFEPTIGQCLIFPSCQDHNVESNQTDEERISVSFNMTLDIDFNSATIGKAINK